MFCERLWENTSWISRLTLMFYLELECAFPKQTHTRLKSWKDCIDSQEVNLEIKICHKWSTMNVCYKWNLVLLLLLVPLPQLVLTFSILFISGVQHRNLVLNWEIRRVLFEFLSFIQIWSAEKNYQFFHQVHNFFLWQENCL